MATATNAEANVMSSTVAVRDAKHLEELIGASMPAHYSPEDRREFCERMLYLLRHPEANPLRQEFEHAGR